jgi:hypothetical protein
MGTENRRIKREILIKQAERLSSMNIPKTRVNVKDRIRNVYAKIITYFKKKPSSKLSFSENEIIILKNDNLVICGNVENDNGRLEDMALLLIGNCIVGDFLGQDLVNKRVAEY